MGTTARLGWFVTCVSLAVSLLLAPTGFAAFETPEATRVYVYLPWAGELTDRSSHMTSAMVSEGYTHSPVNLYRLADTNQGDNNPDPCFISSFRIILEQGYNLWVHSHSNADRIGVEVYNDYSNCLARYDTLMEDEEYQYDRIEMGGADGKHTILAMDVGIAVWS